MEFFSSKNNEEYASAGRHRSFIPLSIGFFCIAVGLLYLFFVLPPADFASGSTVSIASGTSLRHIAKSFQEAHIIRSPAAFEFFVVLFGGEKKVSPGDYFFDAPSSAAAIARMVSSGTHNIGMVKITLPEGLTRYEISRTIAPKISGFSADAFMEETKGQEGYFFPDTYFFFPSATTETVIKTLRDNFTQKTKEFSALPDNQFKRMLIIASIVEKEAGKDADRATIAGILSNRLAKGMPLEVDAALAFLTGKSSSELTMSDLKIDSPYNTYVHAGLPPAPISNPGISSMRAAANPAVTPYLFFLYDKNNTIHYATTFAGHQKNEALYIK